MHVLTWRRGALLSAAAIIIACVAVSAGSAGSVSSGGSLLSRLNKIQRRTLSGLASFELAKGASSEAGARQRPMRFAPLNVAAADCPTHHGADVKVNQNCLNITDPDLQGRGQAQNETSMAVDSRTGRLVATYNDYRRGDGTCGPSYSSGSTWKDSTLPNNFVRGTAYGGVQRQYMQGSGDPSTAWDTLGNAYFDCQEFMRGGPPVTNNPDQSSGVYVYRSTGTGGASWNFPGRPVIETYTTTGLPFNDKPYMTVDRSSKSPYKNRIYVTWTLYGSDGTAPIYEAYSSDYGETFSKPVLVSTSSSTLCTQTYGLPTTTTSCNEDQYSEPFTAPNGTLYVVYSNFNNTVTGKDNRNQILISKSTNGGASFGAPVKVSDYYDLPDCATYQGGQDLGRACVPEKGSSMRSVFRAVNYPSGGVDPIRPNKIVVTFGSYINRDSKESNGCVPNGTSPTTGNDLYTGVKTAGACNNKVLYSVSTNGGATFTGTTADPRKMPVVPQQAKQKHTDQWFQWAAFSPSGKLAVSYYDRQYGKDETTGSSDVSLSGSGNLKSFATVRVTTSSMPVPTEFPDTQGNSIFYGDYSGLALRGNTAYPLWMDTRDPDLFACGALSGAPKSPPTLCTGTEPDGLKANDQNIYTRALALP